MKPRGRLAAGSVLDNAAYHRNLSMLLETMEDRVRLLEERFGPAPDGDEEQTGSVDTTPMFLAAGDQTPSVAGANFDQLFILANLDLITVTNLDDGVDGQSIDIFLPTQYTVFQNGTGLNLHNNLNFLAAANTMISFRHYNGSWYESSRRVM